MNYRVNLEPIPDVNQVFTTETFNIPMTKESQNLVFASVTAIQTCQHEK